jgi:hypothetical protein
MLEPERPAAVSPGRVLCLPTFNHFLIVNKLLSLSLFLSLSLSLSLSVHTHAHSDILRDSHSSPFSLVPGVFCSSFITPAWPLLVAISSGIFPCTYSHTQPRCLRHHPHEHTSHNCTFTLYLRFFGIHVGPGLHQHPRHRLVSVDSRHMQRGALPLHADDTYQALYGATHALACVSCPANSGIKPAGVALSNCTCNVGYCGSNVGQCDPCVAGTYKSVAGSSPCEQCPADKYAGAGSNACDSCPANSNTGAGSQALGNCTCAAGYAAREAPFSCDPCAAGSVKTAAANTACGVCQAGSFAPHSAMTACQTCPSDTFSSLGSAQCANCSAHEFSTPGADSAEDCLCVAGFFRPPGFDCSSAECAPCALGFFRNATHAQDWGSLSCLPCPTGFSTLSVATVSADGCYQCPAGAYAADRGELGVACVQCGENAQS